MKSELTLVIQIDSADDETEHESLKEIRETLLRVIELCNMGHGTLVVSRIEEVDAE